MSERDELVENLRYAHEHSQQRVWGSLIFKDAADQIERDGREIERLREALDLIATHRAKCRAYDDDMGHQRRDFDAEDVKLMEYAARAALNGENDHD